MLLTREVEPQTGVDNVNECYFDRSTRKEKHINIKELSTLRQFLVRNQRDLEQCLLCWRVDNAAALGVIQYVRLGKHHVPSQTNNDV